MIISCLESKPFLISIFSTCPYLGVGDLIHKDNGVMNYEILPTFHNKAKIMHILFHMICLFLHHNTHYVEIHILGIYNDKIGIIGLDPKYG
jgi:hypothetical protein